MNGFLQLRKLLNHRNRPAKDLRGGIPATIEHFEYCTVRLVCLGLGCVYEQYISHTLTHDLLKDQQPHRDTRVVRRIVGLI